MKIDSSDLPIIILALVPIIMSIGYIFDSHFKNQEMIACYDAAKVNQNINCQKK